VARLALTTLVDRLTGGLVQTRIDTAWSAL
jgi:hypothetical protein